MDAVMDEESGMHHSVMSMGDGHPHSWALHNTTVDEGN